MCSDFRVFALLHVLWLAVVIINAAVAVIARSHLWVSILQSMFCRAPTSLWHWYMEMAAAGDLLWIPLGKAPVGGTTTLILYASTQVRAHKPEEAIEFGRAYLSSASASREDQDVLSDVLSLLAYEHPEQSPSGNLLGAAHQAALAVAVNSAVLQHLGRAQESTLERMFRHTVSSRPHI